jgi:alpha-tubulin suppressor-like RCC1 family protein
MAARTALLKPVMCVAALTALTALAALGALPAASAIAAASRSAQAGYLRAWGDDLNGQLGNGTIGRNVALPVSVKLPAGVRITAVAAGGKHTLALTSAGRVLAWGDNFDGQLGDGASGDSHVPVPVPLPRGTVVTGIAAGDVDSMAVTSAGQIYSWGNNQYGQLGDGSTVTRRTPVRVLLPGGVKAVAAGASYNYSLALTSAGQVLTWGYNGSGQLGNGFLTSSEVPTRVHLPRGVTIKQVANGGYDGLALSTRGQLYAWGDNQFGELGDGTRISRVSPVLVKLPKGVRITAIAGGSQHSLALTSAGRVLAWGRGSFGQLGDASTRNSDVPVAVRLPARDKVTAISAGGGFSLALTSAGTELAWGHNTFGQLGDASERSTEVPVPVRIPGGVSVIALAVGPTTRHSLAVVVSRG